MSVRISSSLAPSQSRLSFVSHRSVLQGRRITTRLCSLQLCALYWTRFSLLGLLSSAFKTRYDKVQYFSTIPVAGNPSEWPLTRQNLRHCPKLHIFFYITGVICVGFSFLFLFPSAVAGILSAGTTSQRGLYLCDPFYSDGRETLSRKYMQIHKCGAYSHLWFNIQLNICCDTWHLTLERWRARGQ